MKDIISIFIRSDKLFNILNLLFTTELIFYIKNGESLLDKMRPVKLSEVTKTATVEMIMIILIAAVFVKVLRFVVPYVFLWFAIKFWGVETESCSDSCLMEREIRQYLLLTDNTYIKEWYQKKQEATYEAKEMITSLSTFVLLIYATFLTSSFIKSLLAANRIMAFFTFIPISFLLLILMKHYSTLEIGHYVGYEIANHVKKEICEDNK